MMKKKMTTMKITGTGLTSTSFFFSGDRDNSLTAGASDYVTKPVDVEQLMSVIRSWLS
jgi:CheY-like chemotaxis protein